MNIQSFLVETLCPVLTSIQEEYDFSWIIGGSAPLHLFNHVCFTPGDIDVWVWRGDKPFEAKEMRVLSEDLAHRLHGKQGRCVPNSLDEYTATTILKCCDDSLKPHDESLHPCIQVIDVTESRKNVEAIGNRGANILGASILDLFDISVCKVGIVVPNAQQTKAYNDNHLGKTGLTYYDMGGKRRCHDIDDTCPDREACKIFHDGKCEALCTNDVVAHPLTRWDGRSTSICRIEAGIPHLVFRPSTANDILPGLDVEPYFRHFDYASRGIGDYRPNMHSFMRLQLMRVDQTTSLPRIFKYAERGFYPIFEDIDPKLLEIKQNRFSKTQSSTLSRDTFLTALPGLTIEALKAQHYLEKGGPTRFEYMSCILCNDIFKLAHGETHYVI